LVSATGPNGWKASARSDSLQCDGRLATYRLQDEGEGEGTGAEGEEDEDEEDDDDDGGCDEEG